MKKGKKILILLILFVGFISCKKKEITLEVPKSVFQENIYNEFKSLYELYNTDSKGGWPNNDQGRFSNDDATVLEGLVYLYEVTKDPDYVRHFFDISDRLNANDDIARNKVDKFRNNQILPGWSSNRYTNDNSPHIFDLGDALILYPYVRMYKTLISNQFKNVPEASKVKAIALLGRAENSFNKIFLNDWKQFNPTSGYFQDPYFTTVQIHMPLNQLSIVGQLCLDLYAATKKNIYKDYATQTANFLKSNLRVVDNCYEWNYTLPFSASDTNVYLADDIGHGNYVVFFAANCYSENVVFNQQDMSLFVNTFLNKISKGNIQFAGLVDGRYPNSEPLVTQYYVLAPFNKDVGRILDSYYKNRNIILVPNSILNHIGYHYILYYSMMQKYNR